MIKLYSTDCPKCKVLEKKLEQNNIVYTLENKNFDELIKNGFANAPILQVDDEFLDFKSANEWIKENV